MIVIDSGSDDGTEEIVERYSNVNLIIRRFDDHATQWNFGVSNCVTNWVLALDADYILSDNFKIEIEELENEHSFVAYGANFNYCIKGVPLRGTLYPSRYVLFNKNYCTYVQDGHTQLLEAKGETKMLNAFILHICDSKHVKLTNRDLSKRN